MPTAKRSRLDDDSDVYEKQHDVELALRILRSLSMKAENKMLVSISEENRKYMISMLLDKYVNVSV